RLRRSVPHHEVEELADAAIVQATNRHSADSGVRRRFARQCPYGPDSIGGSGHGVFTPEPGNHVVLNEEGFCYNPDGSTQFLSKNAGASRVITAATLMHELHHLDDEYEWVDGAADDVKAHAEAEWEAYEAE